MIVSVILLFGLFLGVMLQRSRLLWLAVFITLWVSSDAQGKF